jgi:two-component system KDP operon response regulator KdpE
MTTGATASTPPPCVLVIEDDGMTRQLISDVLTAAGYEVCVTSNGEDGVREFVACTPAVVITNMVMPGKHGLDTIHQLRRSSQVPILAISSDSETYREAALRAGATEFIEKPFGMGQLLDATDRLACRPARR